MFPRSLRTRCLVLLVLLHCLAAAVPLAAQGAVASGEVAAILRQAGNAEDDAVRLDLLKKLQSKPGLGPGLKSDLDKMVAVVDRWVHDKGLWQWFGGEVHRTADYDFGIAADSPLYPLTCLYRGRMLVWVTNESGHIISYHDKRRQFLDKAVEQFRIAREAFPENRIVRMYLGEPIPVEQVYEAAAAAPPWANLQREGLERLADIVEWWIDHRMQDDGQFGGAWDDDCEMWRSWVPVMIAFESPKITAAQARFSAALLSQSYMRQGYTDRVYDVEHTAEPSSDTIVPMMHLAPDDPAWKARAVRIAELMETLWTGVNQRGMLQFKSTYFGGSRVDENPKRACDTPYHVRAVEPAMLLWLRTGDPRLGKLFCRWMDTWVDASRRSERGKPAGVLPAAIHWPDGQPAGPGKDWWDPRHHDEPTLYEWPSAVSKMTDALLLTYHMTHDEKYLEPIRSMAAIRLNSLKTKHTEPVEPGSEAWCGAKLGFLAATLAKYQVLTGNKEFDELLARDDRAMAGGQSGEGREQLASALEQTAAAMRVNFPGFTSEVRYTDRVFAFPRLFGADMMFAEPVPSHNRRPDTELLYAAAAGDRGNFGVFPLNAVRWLTPPRAIAALVTARGARELSAELFHFGRDKRPMGAEFYLLAPGRYTLQLCDAATDQPVAASVPVAVDGPKARVAFDLPPGKLCRLRITAAE